MDLVIKSKQQKLIATISKIFPSGENKIDIRKKTHNSSFLHWKVFIPVVDLYLFVYFCSEWLTVKRQSKSLCLKSLKPASGHGRQETNWTSKMQHSKTDHH